MRSENLLLYVVCILMALLFLGLAGLNFFSAGNFTSTDSLFFTTVSGLMALVFLLVPVTSYLADRKAKKTAAGELAAPSAERGALQAGAGGAAPAAALRAPVRYADAVDARGRRIPPDVARMVELMKDRETEAT